MFVEFEKQAKEMTRKAACKVLLWLIITGASIVKLREHSTAYGAARMYGMIIKSFEEELQKCASEDEEDET